MTEMTVALMAADAQQVEQRLVGLLHPIGWMLARTPLRDKQWELYDRNTQTRHLHYTLADAVEAAIGIIAEHRVKQVLPEGIGMMDSNWTTAPHRIEEGDIVIEYRPDNPPTD